MGDDRRSTRLDALENVICRPELDVPSGWTDDLTDAQVDDFGQLAQALADGRDDDASLMALRLHAESLAADPDRAGVVWSAYRNAEARCLKRRLSSSTAPCMTI
jgi:hypothetical protein